MRVLVVDDEKTVADTTAKVFQHHNFEALAAYTVEDAIRKLAEFRPDLLVVDVMLGKTTGIELGAHCRKAMPSCKVLLMSGQTDTSELLEDARARGEYFEIVDGQADQPARTGGSCEANPGG